VQELLSKYAGHLMQSDMQTSVINLYRTAKKHDAAAFLILQVAHRYSRARCYKLFAKKIYVLAALQVSESYQVTFYLFNSCLYVGYEITRSIESWLSTPVHLKVNS
jgi:hypothetical protein